MSKKYVLPGCANICRDGFTITKTWTGEMPNMKEIIENTNIIIHCQRDYSAEYKSVNGFTVRKIFELINSTYLNYIDKCNHGDDYFSDTDIHGFELKGDDVCIIYSKEMKYRYST